MSKIHDKTAVELQNIAWKYNEVAAKHFRMFGIDDSITVGVILSKNDGFVFAENSKRLQNQDLETQIMWMEEEMEEQTKQMVLSEKISIIAEKMKKVLTEEEIKLFVSYYSQQY
jgi:hypothetical protein